MSGDQQTIVHVLLLVLIGLGCWSLLIAIKDLAYYWLGRSRTGTQKPCRHCGSVAIPERDICPECFVERHHVADPFDA